MPRPGMNIAALERLLEERRSEISKLLKKRGEVEKQLRALDRKIDKLEGGVGGRRGGPGSRARNDQPLADVIESVMRQKGKPMKVAEIVEGAIASGYKSNSDNFSGIVNQNLIKDKRFENVSRGLYQLKK